MTDDKNNHKKIEDFIGKEITSMSELFELLDALNWDQKKYIFRGQSNSNLDHNGEIEKNKFNPWELESSLRRNFRIKRHQNNSEVLNWATNGIIKKIKDSSSQQDGLEILSEMQHFKKPTILIDFTSDFLSSLFFAFSNENFSSRGEGFVSIYFKTITIDPEYKISDIIKTEDKIYICPKTIQRGISQRSYFILDNHNNILDDISIKLIKINFGLKEKIILFLDKKGINHMSIFPDNEGTYEDFFFKSAYFIFMKGNALAGLNRHEEAMEKYEQATMNDTEHDRAFYNWGISLEKFNRNEMAMEKYEQATIINPKHDKAFYNWGFILQALDRDEEALEKFEQATIINPQHCNAFNNWGSSFSKLKEHDKAIEKFEQATIIDPQHDGSFHNWGNSLMFFKKYDKAIEKYERATTINSKNYTAFDNWGSSLMFLKKYNKAIEKFEQATIINPKYYIAFNNWGNALGTLDRHEDAIEKYEQATIINPQYDRAFENWGLSLFKLNRLEEASEKLERAKEIKQQRDDLKNSLKK